MVRPTRKRLATLMALLLASATLSGCGCGPLGLRWCHGGGYYHGGYGGR